MSFSVTATLPDILFSNLWWKNCRRECANVEILILDFPGGGRLENPVFGLSRLSRAPSLAHGIVELNWREAIRFRPRHDGESGESDILTAHNEPSRDFTSPLLDSSLQCP